MPCPINSTVPRFVPTLLSVPEVLASGKLMSLLPVCPKDEALQS